MARASREAGFRVAEFFAGMGLVRMGLEAAGLRVVYANDIDGGKRGLYEGHFRDGASHFHLGDIHKVEAGSLPRVDLATASFPCTDLSLAGGRAGLNAGPQSSAFWGFVRILEEMGGRRPRVVMLENVLGFLSSHGGADFRAAVKALNGLGYAVDVAAVDARWFVPQSRPRLFIVGAMEPGRAAAEPGLSRVRPEAVVEFVRGNRDLRWAFHELPEPPERAGRTLTEILEPLAEDDRRWWPKKRREYLYGQFSARHREMADAMIAGKKWSYGTVFRRVRAQEDGEKRSMGELRVDGVAGCLRTPKGGSARQILFKAGYGRYAARLLTARECARLMGADEFVLPEGRGAETRALFGFGDAVCVPAVAWVAEHLLRPLLEGKGSGSPTAAAGVGEIVVKAGRRAAVR